MSLSYPQDRTCPYQPPSGYLSTDGPVSRVTLYDGRAAWLVTGRAEIRTLLADPRVSADRTNLDFPIVSERMESIRRQPRFAFPAMDSVGFQKSRI
ncbi:hypothetical protein [Kitasatospora sp. NPDC088351]|uniref:hypothetical protein n=1 Tax=Kitasatospora sp. NPDC088351 TaxID=3155180 RepID=UPI00344AA6CC